MQFQEFQISEFYILQEVGIISDDNINEQFCVSYDNKKIEPVIGMNISWNKLKIQSIISVFSIRVF